jgi:hypothetical protein
MKRSMRFASKMFAGCDQANAVNVVTTRWRKRPKPSGTGFVAQRWHETIEMRKS